MAPRTLFAVTASLAIVAAVFFREASAQTSGCTASILSLASCLGYITGTSPLCLCQVLNGGASQFGVTVNQTQALQLPGACNVETPPASNCNGGSASPGGAGSQSPPTNVLENGSFGKATFSVGFLFLLVGAVAGLVAV
ncbi:unnamed protein product [Spirodela intermedia]|uniref:Bifunctional inhibitor/plant lipid transfer protein/seed storage helical domain-containing protein n=1 Tax=Spirodela intermedia TaxID=51605 RepID=A0A7I8IXQ1_SPIIN|nr:unnamed protein product [Spirodela intermedia]CAA6662744.1 unnamed protein product [Spirodela intermedia]